MRHVPALVTAFLLAVPLSAGSIGTYIFTGTASGTAGSASFTGVTLTISATGDIGLIGPCTGGSPQCFLLDISNGSAAISIGGVGSGTFSAQTYVFDNQTAFAGAVGFGLVSDDIQIHDTDLGSTIFSTYDLATSLGPICCVTDPSTPDWVNLPTTLGNTTISSYTDVSFQAIVGVPEPCTLVVAPALLWFFLRRASRR